MAVSASGDGKLMATSAGGDGEEVGVTFKDHHLRLKLLFFQSVGNNPLQLSAES